MLLLLAISFLLAFYLAPFSFSLCPGSRSPLVHNPECMC